MAGSSTPLSVGTAPIFSTEASICASTPSFLRRRMCQCSASSGSMPAVGSAASASSAFAALPSKCAMKCSSASSLRFSTRSSASLRSSSSISAYGVMWFGLTIARSRPASTQWCRKTEFRTERAGSPTPNETFDTPSDVSTPGSAALTIRMPSIVSTADGRHSSSPVVRVNVSRSKISSSGSIPCSSHTSPWMRCATSSLRSRVLAIPTSSMVSAISAAPCALAIGATRSSLSRPASRLIELTIARPGIWSSAVSMTSGSVESTWIGAGCVSETFLATSRICSSSSWRSVSATQRSSTCAPPSTWSSATWTMPS